MPCTRKLLKRKRGLGEAHSTAGSKKGSIWIVKGWLNSVIWFPCLFSARPTWPETYGWQLDNSFFGETEDTFLSTDLTGISTADRFQTNCNFKQTTFAVDNIRGIPPNEVSTATAIISRAVHHPKLLTIRSYDPRSGFHNLWFSKDTH